MARYHYQITSKKRIYELQRNADGSRNYRIDGVSDVVENNKQLFEFQNISHGKTDIIFNCILFVSVLNLIFIILLFILGGDILNYDGDLYELSSRIVAFCGFLIALISIPKIRSLFSKVLNYGKAGNILFVFFSILFISFLCAIFVFKSELSIEVSNIISVISILISIFYQK